MADQTPFGISTMTVTINDQAFCASECTITTSAGALPYTCLSGNEQGALASNIYTWGGSVVIGYDDTAATMQKIMTLASGTRADQVAFVVAITTSNAQLITITGVGGVVITGIDSSFDYENVPQATVSFVGAGAMTEVNTDP